MLQNNIITIFWSRLTREDCCHRFVTYIRALMRAMAVIFHCRCITCWKYNLYYFRITSVLFSLIFLHSFKSTRSEILLVWFYTRLIPFFGRLALVNVLSTLTLFACLRYFLVMRLALDQKFSSFGDRIGWSLRILVGPNGSVSQKDYAKTRITVPEGNIAK